MNPIYGKPSQYIGSDQRSSGDQNKMLREKYDSADKLIYPSSILLYLDSLWLRFLEPHTDNLITFMDLYTQVCPVSVRGCTAINTSIS